MKNSLIFTAITVFLVILILPYGCEEDEGGSEQFKLLTAHIWTYDSIYTICKDAEIIWFIDLLHTGAKGGTIMFNADGKFVSPFESGSWKFSNGETEIITFDSDDPADILGHVRIDNLTEELLEVTDLVDVIPSDTCYVKSRLVK